MYLKMVGSLNNLEALFAQECILILASGMDEDPKFDEKRRSTLYVVPGKKYKKKNDEMHFRCCSSGHILWFNVDGAIFFSSFAIKDRIEEVEDVVESAEEAALVADLNQLV